LRATSVLQHTRPTLPANMNAYPIATLPRLLAKNAAPPRLTPFPSAYHPAPPPPHRAPQQDPKASLAFYVGQLGMTLLRETHFPPERGDFSLYFLGTLPEVRRALQCALGVQLWPETACTFFVYLCVYVFVCVCMYVCDCVCRYVCVCMFVCMFVCVDA